MTGAIRRWWTRSVWLAFWRWRRPKMKVVQDAPKWAVEACPAEVLRTIYHSGTGKSAQKWTAIRVVQLNAKTAWVQFADGGFAKFRRPRIKPALKRVRMDYDAREAIVAA